MCEDLLLAGHLADFLPSCLAHTSLTQLHEAFFAIVTHECRAAAGACFLLGALLMVCAILVAMTLDGQSGKGLLAEHQDANPVPRARAAEDPWSDAEAQTGALP